MTAVLSLGSLVTEGYEDLGSRVTPALLAGDTHQTQPLFTPPRANARPGDPQVSGQGRAPYADLSEPEQSSYKARMHKVHRRRSKICTPRAPIRAKLSGKL